jgi:hypothetical protein
MPSTHFLQLDATHPPPPDDDDEDVPPPVHALLWQVPPSVVQSEQVAPEAPQAMSMLPG